MLNCDWVVRLGWASTLAADRVVQLPRAVPPRRRTAVEEQRNAELQRFALVRPDQHTGPGLPQPDGWHSAGTIPPAGAPVHDAAEPPRYQSGSF